MSTTSEAPAPPAKSSRRKWLIGLGVLALCAIGLLLAIFIREPYPTTQTVERSFTIANDFTQVRKILVRTDAVKQIVTMGGQSTFLSQQWSTVGGELDLHRLLNPQWQLELHGTLGVRTKDSYVGEQDVKLRQVVTINQNELVSVVQLIAPSERLLQYSMRTRFSRDPKGDVTLVEQKLTQEILTDAPKLFRWVADRRVKQSAARALDGQEAAIRKVVAENEHQQWLFPLR